MSLETSVETPVPSPGSKPKRGRPPKNAAQPKPAGVGSVAKAAAKTVSAPQKRMVKPGLSPSSASVPVAFVEPKPVLPPVLPSVSPVHSTPDVSAVAVVLDASKPQVAFNFGLIKNLAKPGSWRRGYHYYKQSQVQDITLTPTGVLAQVKGNYKDFYTTEVDFNATGVAEVRCTCPLKEPWCKHVVAVALSAVDQTLWEAYWGLPENDDMPELVRQPQGRFQFWLDMNRQTGRAFGLKVFDRLEQTLVRQPEQVMKATMKQQTEFSELQKRELAVLQGLIKAGFNHNTERQGWFHLPMPLAEPMLTALSQTEEVLDKQGHPVAFEATSLPLKMGVNASTAGHVMVSLHWQKAANNPPHLPPNADEWPLEELQIFSKEVAWGFYNRRFYPLATALSKLPKYLTKGTFVDIKDADGGKFVYEELPKIRQYVLVDEAEVMEELKLQKKAPKPYVVMELVDPASLRLRATLSYQYDETKVPFSKAAPDTPYVMVTNKKKETLYWIQRDVPFEQKAYETFVSHNMVPMQTNHFQAEGDDAVDFYNSTAKKLRKEGWVINAANEKDLKVLKAAEHPLKVKVRLEFDESVDFFIVEASCQVGKHTMDMDEVQSHLFGGKKYFYLNGHGFVEVPLAKMLAFNRSMQAMEPQNLGPDRYRVPTYKAGLIGELIDQHVDISMSRKFKKFWDVLSAGKTMEELSIPESVNAELRPYQERGFHWLWFLYSYGLNGILADDMGLGKTLQALVTVQQAKDKHGGFPSLIVCPTSVVYNWQNEIKKFTPDLTVLNLTGPDRFERYKQIKNYDIVVTSYAILRRDINALKDYPFRFAILDESQNIKNAESQTAAAAKKLQAQHRLALSGTPIENRLGELWSLFDFLMPGFLEEAADFRRRFIIPIEERGSRDAENRLKKQVFPFILRRMKRDVLKDLPPKMELVQYCDLTDAQYDLYMKILERTKEELQEEARLHGGKPSHNAIFTALIRLRQVCNHPSLVGPQLSEGLHESGKFEALKEMLSSAIANGHRILVFSQFVEMLKIVKDWLVRKDIKHEYLTGQTKDRQGAVDRFNTDESIPVFLVSLKAGGTGLNLTGADFVIHYDPWWNPAAEDQATDRAHRIGQTKSVFVYRLIARGTVEEKIMRLKERKRSLVDSIIAADRTMGKTLSLEDLKDILSPDF